MVKYPTSRPLYCAHNSISFLREFLVSGISKISFAKLYKNGTYSDNAFKYIIESSPSKIYCKCSGSSHLGQEPTCIKDQNNNLPIIFGYSHEIILVFC